MKPHAEAFPTPRTRPGRDYRRSGALVTRSRSPLPTERDLGIIPLLRTQTGKSAGGPHPSTSNNLTHPIETRYCVPKVSNHPSNGGNSS